MAVTNKRPADIPLVVHLIYRLDFGGLETLLVDCINHMPPERYRHAVVCLTGYTAFADKITRPGVELYALDKQPGLGLGIHVKLFKLLRRLRPSVLHTYNFACAEYAAPAWLAGVPVRVHAEHGRDASDPQGLNRKHNFLRRALVPFIDRYVPVSHDLARWLTNVVGIPSRKSELIMNGVDTVRFAPGLAAATTPWAGQDVFVIGTVGRLQDVKDQASLIAAFALLCTAHPEGRARLRLAVVGDGPLRDKLAQKAQALGVADLVWFPGARNDIPELMRSFDLFVLSSIAEGTPVTLLEAMACGLPVVATAVGGIPEVVQDGVNGALVPAGNPQALSDALGLYAADASRVAAHGAAARTNIERHYSVAAMVGAYTALYDRLGKRTNNLNEITQPCAE
ncbi:TIGR03088 family PEP-CTERM/XrtA system glycosyltransferase [Massilia sp. YIM B02769]|uniref:TIGR03088 family PEP-CTERM/XrtA system glycosyltransferase n=1 Tax=Massilia sp. YIM B02769 TaxID=3050129 RepID=UPI0025B6381B|nr:TIGR03088 family PEP-CTERM/XrtA system glycosyltransferase [Massilia sp. YIM B02769]MDN4057002.1 TIGR03088 family PEP-CTERM/XrtA system glycosyltransferase [Massilia sp. YIM B02769]